MRAGDTAMPRGTRLDAPGALYHVMVRGIERKRIVVDDKDRKELGVIITLTFEFYMKFSSNA